MNDVEIDVALRRFGRSVREDAASADAGAALAATHARTGAHVERGDRRAWPRVVLVAAVAAASMLAVSGALWLVHEDDSAVRSIDSPPTNTTVEVTAPSSAAAVTSTDAARPTPSSSATPAETATTAAGPVGTTAPAPTSTLPPASDPFAAATAVASTADGVLLGLPDGSWIPAGIERFGKAVLIDRWVLFQEPSLDPNLNALPPIEMHSVTGDTTLDGFGEARLLDAGWIGGAPFALISVPTDSGTGWNAESVRLVDLRDPSSSGTVVTELDPVEGMLFPLVGAALEADRIAMLQTQMVGSGSELVVLTIDGEVLYTRPFGPQEGYDTITANGGDALLLATRFRVTGGTPDDAQWTASADVLSVDLTTLTEARSSTDLPPSDTYGYLRVDGAKLGYASTTEQFVLEPQTGTLLARPDLPLGVIAPRRDAPTPP